MKTSGLLKWLSIPAALILVYVAIKLFSSSSNDLGADSGSESDSPKLTLEESKEVGVDGDTPKDTIATLVGQVKQLRSELKQSKDESAKARAENDRLRLRDGSIDQRIQNALRAERERWTREHESPAVQEGGNDSQVKELQRRLDELRKSSADADLPVGLGFDEKDSLPPANTWTWIEPAGSSNPNAKDRHNAREQSLPTAIGEAVDRTGETASSSAESIAQAAIARIPGASRIPVFTAPENATLLSSVAMTAMIGRVPIDGTVNDPFPFTVLVGADNLLANGFELPQLEGAVMRGTASGDWTLSCVRGQIRSITFIFQDGTVRTIPSDSGREGSEGRSQNRESLGWISDPYGIPCISGERRSNAQQYLTTQTLVTAAGAAATSMIDSKNGDYSFVRGRDGTTIGTVGISGQEAMDRVLANGVQDMSQWVNRLYGQAYASVYVKPGAEVAVHLDRPLYIDLDPHGRQVIHEGEVAHAFDLD